MPSWYLDEPPASPMESWVVQAFHELSTDRALGMTVGPIPESALAGYMERAGLDYWNAMVFKFLIRKLDNDYLDDLRAKQKPETPPNR